MSKETLSTSETKKETPKHVNALEEKYKEETKQDPHATRLDPDNIQDMVEQSAFDPALKEMLDKLQVFWSLRNANN